MSKAAQRFPRIKRRVVALAACLLSALPVTAGAQQLAFPGATGFGRFALGGRGGAVYRVTNLNDSGSGSLRACVDASGPRTCVFRIGGTINLSTPLTIDNPYLTIAGQTAPGGGIQLKRTGTFEGAPLYCYNTHNVVIRHVRSRPANPTDDDAITLDNCQDVILDHVSLAWGRDENLGATGALVEDVTVSNSIIAEGLNPHSKGFLACNGGGTTCQRITSRRNIYALNNDRNPNIDMTNSVFEMYNDIVYGAGSQYAEIHSTAGGSNVNIVNNYFKKFAGGNTWCAISYPDGSTATNTQVYASGNTLDLVPCLMDSAIAAAQVGSPVSPVPTLVTAATAYTEVRQRAGAWPRDSADTRFVNHVTNRTGVVPSSVTGLPTLAAGTACTDADADGICLAYETTLGTSDTNAADRNGDHDGDGYTNLEEFLDKKHNDVTPP